MSESNDAASPAPRSRWSKAEDDILTTLVNDLKRGSSVDWRKVAQELPNRSNKDCRKRWLKIDAQWRQGQWSKAEDQALRKAVAQQNGKLPWKLISDSVQSRNPDQCAKRWRNALDPSLVRGHWAADDDEKLLYAIQVLGGRDWKRIVEEYFPGRSRLDLSNRYTMLLRRGQSSSTTPRDPPTISTRSCSSSPDVEASVASQSPQSDAADEYMEVDTDTLKSEPETHSWETAQFPATSYAADTSIATSHALHNITQPANLDTHQYHYDSAHMPHTWYNASSVPAQLPTTHSPMTDSASSSYQYYPQWQDNWHASSPVAGTHGTLTATSQPQPPPQHPQQQQQQQQQHMHASSAMHTLPAETAQSLPRTIKLDHLDASQRLAVMERIKSEEKVTLLIH